MPASNTVSKEHLRRLREQELVIKREKEKKELVASLKQACNELKLLLADNRYKGYVFALESMLKACRIEREGLTNVGNDDYIKRGRFLDGKIEILKQILIMPEEIFTKYKSYTERKYE